MRPFALVGVLSGGGAAALLAILSIFRRHRLPSPTFTSESGTSFAPARERLLFRVGLGAAALGYGTSAAAALADGGGLLAILGHAAGVVAALGLCAVAWFPMDKLPTAHVTGSVAFFSLATFGGALLTIASRSVTVIAVQACAAVPQLILGVSTARSLTGGGLVYELTAHTDENLWVRRAEDFAAFALASLMAVIAGCV